MMSIDVGAAGAVLRIALGAALVLLVRSLFPGAGLGGAVAALALMLFGVKAFAAVARRVVPTTAAVRAHYEWRRNLARFHDSYQWRKLVWFGIGILVAGGAAPPRGGWEVPLGAACVLGGALAEAVWRRKGLPLTPPLRG
jgi:hypothetical protein